LRGRTIEGKARQPQNRDSHEERPASDTATTTASEGELSHEAGIAQRAAQGHVSRSPQVRRLAQLQEMVDDSPPMVAQARKAHPANDQKAVPPPMATQNPPGVATSNSPT